MSGTPNQTMACPACGKRYTWKPQFAGRKVSCSCGKIFEATLGLEGVKLTGDVYDVTGSQQNPAAPSSAKPKLDLIAAYPGRRSKPVMQDESNDEVFHPVKDRFVPIVLIAVGVAARLVQLVLLSQSGHGVAIIAMAAVELIANSCIVVLGAYFAAIFLDVNFGNLITAALKLSGITLFAWAAGSWASTIDRDPNSIRGMVLGLYLVVFLYFTLFFAMFELDLQEALTTTVIVGLLQGLVDFGIHTIK